MLHFTKKHNFWLYAVVYDILQRISPGSFLELNIQLEAVRFEPRILRVPVYRATNWAVLTGYVGKNQLEI